MPTRIMLIRHGQTEWNKIERFRGRADIDLDDIGFTQAQATAERLSRSRPAVVYSSPLKRSMRTAQATADALGLEVTAEPGLTDIEYGAWQGLSIEEARLRDPEVFEQWRKGPGSIQFPGGESMGEASLRASMAMDSIGRRHPEQIVAVFTHVTIGRLLTLHLLGLSASNFWKVMLDNCGISTFELRAAGTVALALNDTCHLRPGEA